MRQICPLHGPYRESAQKKGRAFALPFVLRETDFLNYEQAVALAQDLLAR